MGQEAREIKEQVKDEVGEWSSGREGSGRGGVGDEGGYIQGQR